MAARKSRKAVSVELSILAASFRRSLAAENKSPRTLSTYGEAIRFFTAFLEAQQFPTTTREIAREHVEAFITDQLARHKPTTASCRYRALQSFFNWAVAEQERDESPMRRMRPPSLPETPPPVIPQDDIRKLLRSCDGKEFRPEGRCHHHAPFRYWHAARGADGHLRCANVTAC